MPDNCRTIEIHFQRLPNRNLTSNKVTKGSHFGAKSGPTVQERKFAWRIGFKLAIDPVIEIYDLEITFVIPKNIHLDHLNYIQATKPWIDGLQDAEVIAEDDWKHMQQVTINPVIYTKGEQDTIFLIKEKKDGAS